MPHEELVLEKLDRLMEYNKQQDKKLQEVHDIVTGNGTPENGMIVKQARHESESAEKFKSIIAQMKLHWGMFAIIIGTLVKVVFF